MPVKKYEIWIGHYNLNDGMPEPAKPQKMATVVGATFKMACLKYELGVKMNHVLNCENLGQPADDLSCNWHYDYLVNRNTYTGHYFESEDDAWETFPKGKPSLIIT